MTDPYSRPARPWDLFNKNLGRVETVVAAKRMDICHGCEHFIKLTTQCTQCGCIMSAKTKLPNAACPVGKWDSVVVSITEDQSV